jgi:hypothetical protein
MAATSGLSALISARLTIVGDRGGWLSAFMGMSIDRCGKISHYYEREVDVGKFPSYYRMTLSNDTLKPRNFARGSVVQQRS